MAFLNNKNKKKQNSKLQATAKAKTRIKEKQVVVDEQQNLAAKSSKKSLFKWITKKAKNNKDEVVKVNLSDSFQATTVACKSDQLIDKGNAKKLANTMKEPQVNDDSLKTQTKAETALQELKKKKAKQAQKRLHQMIKENSKNIMNGEIVSMTNNVQLQDKYIIELFDLHKSYFTGDIEYEVLKGINLKIKKGSFVVILGPSGSGKTTLLNIISGLDRANYGDVFVAGYNLTLLKDNHLTNFRRNNVGFIFQQYNLLTNLTARENAEVGENLAKTKNKEFSIDNIFDIIGLSEHKDKFPSQLSGGQQQRVSIGRALAKNPKILFCDEPTGALDEEMGKKVLEVLINVNRQYGTTLVMVTHNPNFQYAADAVIHVKNGTIEKIHENTKVLSPHEINWA